MGKKPKRYQLKDFKKEAEELSQEDYQELAEALHYHGRLYYTSDEPVISDEEYDAMMRLLIATEELHPEWKLPDTPSGKVGGEIKKEFPEAVHDPPMLSLDNITEVSELEEFEKRILRALGDEAPAGDLFAGASELIYHGELKYDGLAVELVYEKGILTVGSTRGNGRVGEEITHNIKTVKNVPLRLSEGAPEYISIRGEVVMPLAAFESLNEKLRSQEKKEFANPRNAAAGTMRQQDSSIAASRELFFFPYAVGRVVESKTSGEKNRLPEKQSLLVAEYLPSLGFQVSEHRVRGAIGKISELYEEVEKLRSELPFDIDGLVVKLDDMTLWEGLGATSKFPRYATAFKFAGKSGITELLEITYQLGRTGIVTPVAQLAPINVGGVMIRRASLHNIDELQRLDIHIHDKVEVMRAGDVIPKVVGVVEKAPKATRRGPEFPEKCPSCSQKLVAEDVYIRCVNLECPDKQVAALRYFVSRDSLDIEGVGAEWVEKLYRLGIIRDAADLFRLKAEDLNDIEGMGDISRANMLASIDQRRKVEFELFLRALGISNVGGRAAELLAQNFPSIEELKKAEPEAMVQIHEIGPTIAESVTAYFSDPKNLAFLEKLFASGFELIYPEKISGAGEFTGKSFVFTGTLEKLGRSEAQKLVKKLGAKASSSVSKKTDYLIYGESAGSKLDKAKELGVETLTEKEFFEMLEQKGIDPEEIL